MPTLRHDDVRDDLFAGLTDHGRRQFEIFATVYEARQVADRLAELRTLAQLSQRQAARRAGIDQADLSRIESAHITPSLPTLLRLLDAIGGSLVLARKTTSPGQGSKVAKTAAAPSAPKAVAKRTAKSKTARGSISVKDRPERASTTRTAAAGRPGVGT